MSNPTAKQMAEATAVIDRADVQEALSVTNQTPTSIRLPTRTSIHVYGMIRNANGVPWMDTPPSTSATSADLAALTAVTQAVDAWQQAGDEPLPDLQMVALRAFMAAEGAGS